MTKKKIERKERQFGLLLLLPLFLIIFSFIFLPIIVALYISFCKWNYKRPGEIGIFVGLDNYIKNIYSDYFINSLFATFKFTIPTILITFLAGLGIAILLNTEFRGRSIVRSTLLIPWAIPSVSNAVIWEWAFDARFGWVNSILKTFGLIDKNILWLSDPTLAIICIIYAQIWKLLPFTSLVLLAALQTVPPSLLEAAKIDGAGRWRIFKSITFPWISTTALIVVIMNTFWTFQAFDLVFNLTQGGPGNTTQILPYFIWLQAFSWLDMGLGSSTSFILTIIVFILTIIYIRSLYRGRMYA
ncbi:MAG: sugar ABC transporter permease [Nitrososphaeria archaeon]